MREHHWHVFFESLKNFWNIFFISVYFIFFSFSHQYVLEGNVRNVFETRKKKKHSGINMEASSKKGFEALIVLWTADGVSLGHHNEGLCSEYKGVISWLFYFIKEPEWRRSYFERHTKNSDAPPCNVFLTADCYWFLHLDEATGVKTDCVVINIKEGAKWWHVRRLLGNSTNFVLKETALS